MEKIIGLMGAMREEIALLCERMTDKGEETVAGVTFYTGLLQGRRVALCCAGIGKVTRPARRSFSLQDSAQKRWYFRALRAI